MKTREVRFENAYHNTEAKARARRLSLNDDGYPTRWVICARTMKRVEHELCGMAECTCGGLRGEQSDPLALDFWEAYQSCQYARPVGSDHLRLGHSGRATVRATR